jgi:hypothetical protein
MQLQRCAGGSTLILAVRISSGVEKKIQRWGCPNDVTTDLSGLVFSRMVC